jgi:hypothetical protein
MSDLVLDKFNVDDIINLAYQVVLGHECIKGDGFKLVLLRSGRFEFGSQSIFCTDLIRSKSWPYDQDFVCDLIFYKLIKSICDIIYKHR